MPNTLAHEQNNFNLLRLLLACMVVYSHFKSLSGLQVTSLGFDDGGFAVDAFFVISGLLIAASFDAKPKLRGYFLRRVFRIYPLYVLVILVQAAGMILLLPAGAATISDVTAYLGWNLVFLNFMAYDIGGLLQNLNNPSINPSLWTLKIEVGFYLILPWLWMATRRFGFIFLLMLFIASTIYAVATHALPSDTLYKQLPGQLRFFVVGMMLYRYGPTLRITTLMAAIAVLLLFALCSYRAEFPMLIVYPLCVGLLVYLIAMRLPVWRLDQDISYGVYLLHAPLIQFSLLLGYYEYSPGFLLLILTITFALAFAAEKWIEKPWIDYGRKLQQGRFTKAATL